MRYLTLSEVLDLYQRVMASSGGMSGIRDLGQIESAVSQPRMVFEGRELYPTLPEKAAALGHSLIANHPFHDGNKRIGHAAMELFLLLNGHEIHAKVDEQERLILAVASGKIDRKTLAKWLAENLRESESG